MKLSLLLPIIALTCVIGEPEPEVPDGVIKLKVEKVAHRVPNPKKIRSYNPLYRRAAQVMADEIDNKRFYYQTTVQVGTPGQPVDLLLDTGSSDTWMFTRQTSVTGGSQPESFFDPSKSSTFKANGTSYSITYGIGSATGAWATDAFKIGSAQLKQLTIGIAKTAAVSQGIIGVGRPEAECTAKDGIKYQNLPQRLVTEGLINTAAYSLYLDNLNSKSGTILFGGVDSGRYTGKLKSLPITHPKHLAINLDTMTGDGRVKTDLAGGSYPTVLDSGTTLSYFTTDVIERIHAAFNANPSFAIGQKYYCDCNVTKSLTLSFSGQKIVVPSYYFLWPIETIVNPFISQLVFPPNSCYLGLEDVGSDFDFHLMGDNLLRAFYNVYDITNNRIAIAQANPNPLTPSNVRAITKDSIPGAT